MSALKSLVHADRSALTPAALPPHLAALVWRGEVMGHHQASVLSSGHAALDAVLPDEGWPCHSLTEILQAQAGLGEWRLLTPALARLTAQGGSVLLIGAPRLPYLPGLAREGIQPERVIRIYADAPAERLWATEQALKAQCVTAVLSWLPQARPEQIRRLQACAAQHPGLFFAFRPVRAAQESSAAPLRLHLSLGPCPHPLEVHVIKRRGPLLAEPIVLSHWPRGLAELWSVPIGAIPSARPLAADMPAALPATQPNRRGEASTLTQRSHAALDGLVARLSA
ncbi:MAG: translesion DNA synthesis-associated protein ImuA [Aquabacterium sp.]|jgi:protein ImuA|uniref:translesion DNA synthesis-associated protein ImuA n=1 Tax=Aquabacterium sp. TaxID=1872578 RepID=UPI002A35FCEB|nr:translesion DNA synthesis-associated protein ImuA [Aquabacterium sp.]MDX9842260.1 translesion DNA synthesis-associated protein ImuA [Aquabacterium sp.]